MSGYIEGTDRGQTTLFPERLEDWIGEDNPVRVIDRFVDEIALKRSASRAPVQRRQGDQTIIRRFC